MFKGLYENGSNNIHVGAHLTILAAIRDVCKLVVKELTSWVGSIAHFLRMRDVFCKILISLLN